MIKDKELAKDEAFMRTMVDFLREAEIIHNARRYLALRENEIAILTAAINGFDADTYRAEYDAVADRLLEGGE